MEYPKIETLFNRDEKFNVTEVLRNPVYNSFKTWHVTEKIHGMNIRVMLSAEGKVTFGGRSDAASLPADFLPFLYETFTPDKMKAALWLPDKEGKPEPTAAVLYGEGYGAGIQKGGSYNPNKTFRLFDVCISEKWWLDWENTVDVANKLGIKTVPYLGEWMLAEIVERVKAGIPSEVAKEEFGAPTVFNMEGVVARTIEPLFDRRGHRIILKLKTEDFKHLSKEAS